MEAKTWEEELEEAAHILAESNYVVALVGAGLSVESGIPSFRGPGGLWTRFGEPPMNGYQVFLQNPKKWWEERVAQQRQGAGSELQQAMEQAKPNPGHYALAKLERMGVLKYTITQNADNLQRVAGCARVAEIHGNRLKMRCIVCHFRMPREEVSLEVLPPQCPECGGVVKGDVVGFGEPIPPDVLDICQREAGRSDCMLLLGTSGTVYPAAAFPQQVYQKGGALVEINPYENGLSHFCTVAVHGPAGEVLPLLVERLKGAMQARSGAAGHQKRS
ncbi:MAG: NAD-dependent deacetylase [Dehalococcoidia bacterium]|nr:NAD-dependent deacetylase [Dehalococcoidia bacterium]